MGHSKVYGICENKCFVETKTKAQIESEFEEIETDVESKITQCETDVDKKIEQVESEFEELLRKSVMNATGVRPKTVADNLYKNDTTAGFYPDNHFKYVETYFANSFANMFYGCTGLTGILYLDTRKGSNFTYTFCNCTSLIRLCDLYINGGGATPNTMFLGCTSLTTFEDSPYAPEGSRWQFQTSVNFGDCPLDKTSILKVFNGLKDVSQYSWETTITISTTTNAYLNDADKAIATAKGWTVNVKTN